MTKSVVAMLLPPVKLHDVSAPGKGGFAFFQKRAAAFVGVAGIEYQADHALLVGQARPKAACRRHWSTCA